MACVLPAYQPAFELHARTKVHSFKGDDDLLVDRLIAASQRKQVSVDTLQERDLVPFFESCESGATSFTAMQPGWRLPAAAAVIKPLPVPHGLKRNVNERSSVHLAGSPPKKENEVVQAKHQRRGNKQAANSPATSSGSRGAATHSGSHSDSELTSARKPRGGAKPSPTAGGSPALGNKHQRDAGVTTKAPAAVSGGAQRQSPSRKRDGMDMRQLAAASAAAGASLRTPGKGSLPRPAMSAAAASKFAGPAFTNSPTPDSLPFPTSSLLLQEAADGLRARLTL